MKTIFDKSTRDELMKRISTLNEGSTAQWGRMTLYEMLMHCCRWDEMILQNKKYKRVLIGFFIGRLLLKNEIKDDKPMRHNNPTIPELKVKQAQGDIESEKMKWISLKKGIFALFFSRP